ESKYLLAKMAYQSNDYTLAEKLCFEYISNYPSYPTFMVKTYILLSDVYVAQQDYFKARVTLQTIIDTYEKRDELYQEASEKLQKVKALENQGSKIVTPQGAAGFSDFEK